MDEKFLALQAIHKRMEGVRSTGSLVDLTLYSEWDKAYQEFRTATDEWKRLTTHSHSNPTS